MSDFTYRDADEVGRRYMMIGESRGAPPVASSRLGTVAIRCARCTVGVKTVEKRGDTSRPGRWRERLICFNCRQPWTGMQIEVSPDVTYDPRRAEDRVHQDLDEFLLLKDLVEPRPSSDVSRSRWDFAVTVWLAYLDARIGTVDNILDEAERSGRVSRWWNAKDVRKGIAEARRCVSSRADRRGMLLKAAA